MKLKKKKKFKKFTKKNEITNSESTENLKYNKFDLEEDIIPEKEKIELEEIPEENKIKSIERETRLQEIRIKYLQLEKKKRRK